MKFAESSYEIAKSNLLIAEGIIWLSLILADDFSNSYKSDYKNEIIALANIEILKGKEFYDMKEYQDALIHFNKAIE